MNRIFRLGCLPLALAVAGTLRADDAAAAPAAPAAPAEDAASLRADNRQLTDELAAAWKESDKLKADLAAAKADAAKSTADAADLRSQLEAAKSQAAAAAPAPASPAPDAGPQLSDVQDKLATALRSFSVIQNENSDLRAAVDKLTSEKAELQAQLDANKATIATLQVQANLTSQIVPLRNELRQAQDETSQLANENERLRNRIALLGPGPGEQGTPPTRPGAEHLAPEPVAPAPAAPPPPEAKSYVIAEGDTLTRISRKFYGSSGHWEEILAANRGVLKDEKSLPVGSTIKIP
jgi:nucleoid-associated protein YgaU